jgi:nucleotide-binding universal stress UspA family protein
MNAFPTKILLATDGSEDAYLATRAAIDLSRKADSELYLVHVWHDVPTPYARSFVRAQLRREAQEVLDKQVEKIENTGERLRRLTSGKGGPSMRSSTSARNCRSGY